MRLFKFFAVLMVVFILSSQAYGQGGQRAWQGTSGLPSDMSLEAAMGNLLGFEKFHKFGSP